MILIKKLFSRYIPIGLKRYLVSTSTEKPLIYLSGIQPSGRLHLGNYLGAIKPLVGIQTSSNVASLMLLMADLHALTTVRCPQSLLRNMQHLWTTLVACGINPILDKGENASGKTVIFQQSSIVGHTELTWILACRCSHQVRILLPF
ncbi:unnamed protein product [Protopolystoma xenopodis]|uniref:Tryptophan--tRNA ligase n=1 Tax=Protopolystoma xenopodis TaxID=117903 RepID=A0A3S5FES0_9PLAT|nr:unnamed protein product [Protopolystoma xenopodis]